MFTSLYIDQMVILFIYNRTKKNFLPSWWKHHHHHQHAGDVGVVDVDGGTRPLPFVDDIDVVVKFDLIYI